MFGYWIGQFLGAIVGYRVLALIAGGVGGGGNYSMSTSGLGQNGWGPGYQGEYSMMVRDRFRSLPATLRIAVAGKIMSDFDAAKRLRW